MRTAPAIILSSNQQANLEQWARSRSLPARVVERAPIVLLAAQGQQVQRSCRQGLDAKKNKTSRRRVKCVST
jgi:hypothetical protein